MTAFTLTTYEGHLALQHTVSYNRDGFFRVFRRFRVATGFQMPP